MPPRREVPECYEQGANKKVRCKVCPNAKWAAYAKGHVEEHVRSSKHRQALEPATARQAGQSNIEQRLAGASSLSTVQPAAPADLTFANLRLPIFHPIAKTGPSEAEEGMWGDYSKYEAGFSAGDKISEDNNWDNGELEVSRNPAAEDNTLLAELLQALDSDPFDATQTQTDPAAWHPYPSKTMLLLDICDNLHRLPISESLMRTFIWILRECGAKDVPSLDALRKTQKNLRSCCGFSTIPCTSLQGNNFSQGNHPNGINPESSSSQVALRPAFQLRQYMVRRFQLAPPCITAGPVSCPITWNLPEAGLEPMWMVHLYPDGMATWMRCGSYLGV
ncbi:hypothetical protein B0H13DRAFT_1875297 [Mycena leptocephala]|nr:hypothetical protein B0H13DRAFT_1875297 [Mycena leptocephala]